MCLRGVQFSVGQLPDRVRHWGDRGGRRVTRRGVGVASELSAPENLRQPLRQSRVKIS